MEFGGLGVSTYLVLADSWFTNLMFVVCSGGLSVWDYGLVNKKEFPNFPVEIFIRDMFNQKLNYIHQNPLADSLHHTLNYWRKFVNVLNLYLLLLLSDKKQGLF
ncbi:MAG: hypothetical protein EAZ15_09475 [Sphingobacteriales bacterium]|nr:MAG: hypothetical protein EAZ15_09475 [Sphingobacteriales bacterium]